MDLILLVLTLAIIGFFMWLITTYVPMPPPFKTAIHVLVIVILVVYVLGRLGFALPHLLR